MKRQSFRRPFRSGRPAAFGRLCVETMCLHNIGNQNKPAAFGRLCVETSNNCLVKSLNSPAAFGRLCVETTRTVFRAWSQSRQPPSGGCVLKPLFIGIVLVSEIPAAFGRLCVETLLNILILKQSTPAAFGRLCVETTSLKAKSNLKPNQPPSGGCVLKPR